MPPSPTRPALRARYDRRREEIVSAAARILARRGYDQTSVPDLAEAIGVSTGSLYHYFASKEELLVAICDQLLEPLLETALARGRGDLRGLIRLWVEHVVEHRDHMLVFQQERHVIERGRAVAGGAREPQAVRAAGRRGARRRRARGALRHGDRRLALLALLGMVNHTAQWYRPRGPLAAREIADGYADLLLAPARGAR